MLLRVPWAGLGSHYSCHFSKNSVVAAISPFASRVAGRFEMLVYVISVLSKTLLDTRH